MPPQLPESEAMFRRFLAATLLLGTVCFAVGGAVHPRLEGDASEHLRIIAGTPYWRPIHLTLLAGSVLSVMGLWCRGLLVEPGRRFTLMTSLAALALGHLANALNTTFMTGSGWELARRFEAGSTEAALIYGTMHPFGLVAARAGNLLVALATLALALALREDARAPRWEPAFLAGAGVIGLVAVLLAHESSLVILTPVALISVWQALVAARALRP